MRLIDADELIKTTKRGAKFALLFADDDFKINVLRVMRKFIQRSINDAPTITPASAKHGKWTPDKVNEPTKFFYCSACKGLIQIGYYASKCYYNYCPHCGAKMDGGDENA